MYDRELDDIANATDPPGSDPKPHVHHEAEAALWWAEAFPQWKGKGDNDKQE